jgi:PEP-CTERM motif
VAGGHYSYRVAAPGVPDGTADFGRYNINFAIELSDLPTEGVPQLEETRRASGRFNTTEGLEDPVASLILNECVFGSRCLFSPGFLFPPSLNPGFHIVGGEATITVTITDAPEPSSLVLIGIPVLGLIGFASRKRPRAKDLGTSEPDVTQATARGRRRRPSGCGYRDARGQS